MQHIAIIYKRSRADARVLANELRTWFEKQDVEVFCEQNIDDSHVACGYQKIDIPETAEVAVVLGGDGTFLSVARFLEDRSTPIIGVNLGGLGFLTEITKENCYHELQQILDGRFEIEERMRLQVSHQRDGREIFRQCVLNDAVINKGALARIVDVKIRIDGRYLTQYRADGLIVATPTGSTAYNLSAGGPIVYPTSRSTILTPICPFTLTNRPIILPSEVVVEVELGERIKDVTLTCDGQVGCQMAPLDKIIISAAANPLRLIKTPAVDYFEILRTKLKWGSST
jgi:NAD+ kinase